MSTVYSAAYTTLVRDQLQDAEGGTEIWADEEIADHVIRAVKDISQVRPYLQESVLAIQDDSKDVDISSLSDRVYIDRVDYYPDRTDRRWRNWKEFGDWLTMDIDWIPSIDAVGTLTGTVTFTNDSQTISGVGTAFDDELTAKDSYIRKSQDSTAPWYRVLNIASATSLTIDRKYAAATSGDTANLTQYRDYKEVARIFWGGMHTLSTTVSTLPTELEQLVVDGGCAYALRGYTKRAREVLNSAVGIISTMDTQIDLVAARITRMVLDISDGRDNVQKQLTAAETAIGKVAARIAAIETLILAADDNVAKITVAPEMTRYVQLMNAQYQQAMGYLQEFKGYITEGGTIVAEDLSVAAGELSSITGILNHGKSYGDECVAYLRSGEAMLRHSIALADRREAVFRDGLKRAQGRQRRTPRNSLLSRET